MFKRATLHILKWLAVVGLMILVKCSSAPKADLVIHNGTIYTMNPEQPTAGLIAVKNGKITFVGAAADAPDWVESSVHTLDLNRRTLTPDLSMRTPILWGSVGQNLA